jgi:hypothetical protein
MSQVKVFIDCRACLSQIDYHQSYFRHCVYRHLNHRVIYLIQMLACLW